MTCSHTMRVGQRDGSVTCGDCGKRLKKASWARVEAACRAPDVAPLNLAEVLTETFRQGLSESSSWITSEPRQIADALIAGPLAAVIAENAQLRAELESVDRAFEGLEETDRARRIGHWIGVASDAETRFASLLVAFHDAIRRPLGVTPDSGAEFYDQRMADEAEARQVQGGQKR